MSDFPPRMVPKLPVRKIEPAPDLAALDPDNLTDAQKRAVVDEVRLLTDLEMEVAMSDPVAWAEDMERQKARGKAKWARMVKGYDQVMVQPAQLTAGYIRINGLSSWRTAFRRNLMVAKSNGGGRLLGTIASLGPDGSYVLRTIHEPKP